MGPSLLAPGQHVGRYLIEVLVARGGMGAVYRARDMALGRAVALKVLREESTGNAESNARFLREARISAQLSHPNIVVVYEAAEEGGVPYLAMEWIDGVTLLDALRGMSLGDRVRVLGEVADALAFAHERGVVHRDVKPANVLIDAHGRARLADFGIARQTNARPETFTTREGMILGTPRYMAPEQTASSNVTPAADQFAWGVLAYEVLTGRHPRDVVGPSFPFQGIDRLPSNVPISPAVADIVRRATALEPQHRFPTTRDLVEAWSFASANAAGAPAHHASMASMGSMGPMAPVPAMQPAKATASRGAPIGQEAPPKRGFGAMAIAALALVICACLGTIVGFAYKLSGAQVSAAPVSPVVRPSATTSPVPTPSSEPSSSAPAPSASSSKPTSSVAPSNPVKPAAQPAPSTAPAKPVAGGKCLCAPTEYYDDLGSTALCPVTPAFAECRDGVIVVCTGPLKSGSCPSDVYPSTAPWGSPCKGVDTAGKARTGKVVKLCNAPTRVFGGAPGASCKGYTNTGRLVTGKLDCN
ncbi:Serine/threonine protein kinase [Labilithrix luteola]|uniref:Serine/threonine protein kinase n=1 Tax=Labilithrix luteola TaxID=1391654 RepID=A0A0K1PYA4_9BACT|nr:serine/threonine-protein kinase [Labilithrix luteola]AKU98508.1 Serine/threonine protein kinase [Labilithrix luteola]